MRALSFSVDMLLAVSLLAVSGCGPDKPDDDDDSPPRVVSVAPAEQVVPVTTTFRVQFSEALNDDTVDAAPDSEALTVVLVKREVVTDAFLSDLRNPPLAESRQDDVVAVEVGVVEGDSVITVAPLSALTAGTAYTLIMSAELRDTAGNPLVGVAGLKEPFVWEVTTDAGAPAVTSTDAVSAANPVVVANRKRITVSFNQPVVGVGNDTLTIEPVSGAATAPVVDAILLNAARTEATLVLGDLGGCERLTPNAAYAIVAAAGIHGDNGQALTPYREEVTTSAACDLVANAMAPPEASAAEVTATIRFETSKASTTEVRFGRVGGPLDCLGGPCPVVGAAARTPVAGSLPPVFAHAVEIGGLVLGESYQTVAFAEDDVGFVATREGPVFTTEVLPKVALNELMANAPGSFEPRDEYIELVNWGDVPVSLAGYALEIDGGDAAGGDSCTLPGDVTLLPGAFVVLAGSTFEVATYGALDEASILRSGASSFCGTLVNSTAQAFVLKDAGGRPISTMTAFAELLPHDDGKSVERTAADAADTATSWCQSRADVGPTPGAVNGVVGRGCEE